MITFTQRGKGLMTGWLRKTDDKIEIRRVGRVWQLKILEDLTQTAIHTFEARKQYLCCQEACRYFGVGAFAPAD
jgi:hypothetical protein